MERLVNIPEAKAKSILIALCSDDSAMARRASEMLGRMNALEHHAAAGDLNKSTKRKAESLVQICIQCQDPFFEEDNNDKACRYHNGNLEWAYDSDVWADHDEDCHGPIDTIENRVQFPEGFIWDCCDKLGHRGGCQRGRHNASNGSRGRYGDTPGTYDFPVEISSEDEQSSHESESEIDDDSNKP